MLYTKTINKNKTFLFIYKKGKCIVNRNVVIYVRKNNKPYNNLGITAGKKVGNAVARNRAKRIIRQAYRENEINMPVGIDIVIVARSSAAKIKSNILSDYLRKKGIKEIKSAVFGEEI
ncbi:MAG: ribonuclease P protein component [Ruminococcus sp.]|nr:ribonuclease P protein component [Ruminococcus sp.]